MRKKFLATLVAVALFGLIGCQSTEEPDAALAKPTNVSTEELTGETTEASTLAPTNTPTLTPIDTPIDTPVDTPIDTPISTEPPTPTVTPIPYDFEGVIEKNGIYNYYTDGKLDSSYVGLAKYEEQWLYFTNGYVDENYTGVAYTEEGMLFVNNGYADLGYSGTVEYLGNTVDVVNGRINSNLVVELKDETILNVEKETVESIVDAVEDIYSKNGADQEFSRNFTTAKEGLYWITGTVEAGLRKSFDYGTCRLLDIFDKTVHESNMNYLYNGSGKCYTHFDVILPEQFEYKMLIAGKPHGVYLDYSYVGKAYFDVNYICNVIDISDVDAVTDSFDESIFSYMSEATSIPTYTFAYYVYTPKESGICTLWFDNVNISKNKNVYKDNELFCVNVTDESGNNMTGSKTYTLSTASECMQFDAEKGKEYHIYFTLANCPDSEQWKNGTVEYSMHISNQQRTKNITGYISVNEPIINSGIKNTYVITPCRKQNIQFKVTQMREDAMLDVVVKDANGNVLQEHYGLVNGGTFTIEDTVKDIDYSIEIIGNRDTNYYMEILYK